MSCEQQPMFDVWFIMGPLAALGRASQPGRLSLDSSVAAVGSTAHVEVGQQVSTQPTPSSCDAELHVLHGDSSGCPKEEQQQPRDQQQPLEPQQQQQNPSKCDVAAAAAAAAAPLDCFPSAVVAAADAVQQGC